MNARECNRSERMILFLYIAGFVCIALTLALLQPLNDAPPAYVNPPDEQDRFLVPWYICQTGKIPTGFEEEVRIRYHGFSYVMYNAFPYLVQGAVMRLVHCFTDSKQILLYAGRFVDVACGIAMTLIVYCLSKRLFRDRRFQWLFCFAVMYWPEVIFIHSYINTDSMCLLSTAIIVYALVCGYQEGFRTRDNIWLSIGIILCALSYYNAYGYILVSIILFAGYFARQNGEKRNFPEMLQKGCFISVLVLLGIGWWFIRCGILYNGDILGLRTVYNMGVLYADGVVNPMYAITYSKSGDTLWEMINNGEFMLSVLNSFIAVFGSMSIKASDWVYYLIKGAALAGLAGCVWQVIFPDGEGMIRREPVWKQRLFHMGMLVCILIPWLILIIYSYYRDYQPQGRYVLVAIVPFVYYMTRGIQRLSGIRILNRVPFPLWLQNIGIASILCLIVGSAVYMVFFRALPMYCEIGTVLP